MSPISQEDQRALNEHYQNLEGKDKAEFLLTSIIGLKFTPHDRELLKTALSEYIVWHKKQHPKSQTCEHCGFLNDNITMFKVLDFWIDRFQAIKEK